jgi:UDPglucose--hexose-1-phosphate uridylyltransferase
MSWHENTHRRWNPLIREWVLVSPQRTQRPWQGQIERSSRVVPPAYDPECYLCPGNARAGGFRNPHYTSTFVFDNDFPALEAGTPEASLDEGGLLIAQSERGICRVVCFSPDHSLTISQMALSDLQAVVATWISQYEELCGLSFISSVQIFENRGAMMGASNPHPHCQIWATERLPNEVWKEQLSQTEHLNTHRSCLLCDYLKIETADRERLVCENRSFVALVPFWAVWPFEIFVAPKTHLGALDEFGGSEQQDLADILKRVTTRCDNLFATPFPYTMGFHQRPAGPLPHPEWHFHAHFYPPLLRSATIRKFMVGFELLGMPQRDITPEAAAARLREASEDHFLGRG